MSNKEFEAGKGIHNAPRLVSGPCDVGKEKKDLLMDIAPCGLDCNGCPQKPANCDGCHSQSDHLWNADCEIRVCCISERQIANCSFCPDFPCQRILDFEADRWEHHTAAVGRLRELRKKRDGDASRRLSN